jgi:hypothetical protein
MGHCPNRKFGRLHCKLGGSLKEGMWTFHLFLFTILAARLDETPNETHRLILIRMECPNEIYHTPRQDVIIEQGKLTFAFNVPRPNGPLPSSNRCLAVTLLSLEILHDFIHNTPKTPP